MWKKCCNLLLFITTDKLIHLSLHLVLYTGLYVQNKQPDLDFLFTHNLNLFPSISLVDNLFSDHFFVLLTLSSVYIHILPEPSLSRGLINWGLLGDIIQK